MILIPSDMAEDCIEIVTLLGKCEGEIINLGPTMAKRIREASSRIERYRAFNEVMNTQAEGA
jgi:hypothetical protein